MEQCGRKDNLLVMEKLRSGHSRPLKLENRTLQSFPCTIFDSLSWICHITRRVCLCVSWACMCRMSESCAGYRRCCKWWRQPQILKFCRHDWLIKRMPCMYCQFRFPTLTLNVDSFRKTSRSEAIAIFYETAYPVGVWLNFPNECVYAGCTYIRTTNNKIETMNSTTTKNILR